MAINKLIKKTSENPAVTLKTELLLRYSSIELRAAIRIFKTDTF